MRQVVKMIRGSGAKELHILISCPPIRYPDFYGINTPEQADLIAARSSVEEIREYLNADSLKFLSKEGMIAATGLPAHSLSMSCFDGVYPVSIGKRAPNIAYPETAENDYSAARNLQRLPLEPAEYPQLTVAI
jgi:amidophosphoribosyltransferase